MRFMAFMTSCSGSPAKQVAGWPAPPRSLIPTSKSKKSLYTLPRPYPPADQFPVGTDSRHSGQGTAHEQEPAVPDGPAIQTNRRQPEEIRCRCQKASQGQELAGLHQERFFPGNSKNLQAASGKEQDISGQIG